MDLPRKQYVRGGQSVPDRVRERRHTAACNATKYSSVETMPTVNYGNQLLSHLRS